MEVQIKNLDVLLAPVLKGKQIESFKSRNLVGPGENYGSVMLALDVKVKDCADELNLVAKMCPPTEFIKRMFNIPVTYKKEVGFYSAVIPTLQEYQRERGCENVIDFVPKYYGSRISLDPEATEVDDDACLLLGNIKVKGFDVGDRLKGFDLETAEFVIKDLATFHAVPIALKLTDPNRFEEKIKPHIIKHITEEAMADDISTGMINVILEGAQKNPECSRYVDKLEKRLLKNVEYFKTTNDDQQNIFWTIIHNDYWVNNTMIKYKDGKPVKNAMIDFQLVTYGNPARDLLFLIYSSLSNKLIAENYENLINLYFETFIKVLTSLQINTDDFSYKSFKEQIFKAATEVEFFHIMIMLKPILLEKDKVKELSDLSENELIETEGFSDLYYSRLWFTILNFAEKGWI